MNAQSLITVDNVTWTPLKPPRDCYYFQVDNILSNNLKIRTDSTDPNTERTVYSMQNYAVQARRNSVLLASEVQAYAQLVAGSGQLWLMAQY